MGALEILQRTPAMAGVDTTVLSSLARAATLRTLVRRERLWDAGDEPRFFVAIRRGILKVVRPTAAGRSIICGLFAAPESAGDLPLIKGAVYPASAIAVSAQLEVVLVPRDRVLEAMRTNTQLAEALVRNAQVKVENLLRQIDVLSAGTVEARLAQMLVTLYERFGDDFDDGSSSIPIRLSRQELAEFVSTSEETAIRVMTRWERAGTVEGDENGFVLKNLPALRAAIGRPLSAQ